MASPQDQLEIFYAALRNLNDLEVSDFRNVIQSVLKPTLRECYLTVYYHRAVFNVEMMLAIKDTKQFQTIGLLARAVFELSVEMKLINLDEDAAPKIELFSRVELLKAARRLVAFKNAHPDANVHYETHADFINTEGVKIDAAQTAMWPDPPTPKIKWGKGIIKHWTKKDFLHRATDLGEPFDRIYHVHYAQFELADTFGCRQPLEYDHNMGDVVRGNSLFDSR